MNIQVVDMASVIAFWLVFTRLSAIFIQLPLFDSEEIPMMVKGLAMLMITYALFPTIEPHVKKDIALAGIDNFWWLTIYNVLVGLVLGYFVNIIMHTFTAAGYLISQNTGFTAITFFDQTMGGQVGPFEKLIRYTMVIMIVTSGALLPMFKGSVMSFENINLTNMASLGVTMDFFINMFKNVFTSSLMLASPLIFTNIILTAILGIIARTVPQMNVLMVSFILNIGFGLLVFVAVSDEFFHVAYQIYTQQLGEWFKFLS